MSRADIEGLISDTVNARRELLFLRNQLFDLPGLRQPLPDDVEWAEDEFPPLAGDRDTIPRYYDEIMHYEQQRGAYFELLAQFRPNLSDLVDHDIIGSGSSSASPYPATPPRAGPRSPGSSPPSPFSFGDSQSPGSSSPSPSEQPPHQRRRLEGPGDAPALNLLPVRREILPPLPLTPPDEANVSWDENPPADQAPLRGNPQAVGPPQAGALPQAVGRRRVKVIVLSSSSSSLSDGEADDDGSSSSDSEYIAPSGVVPPPGPPLPPGPDDILPACREMDFVIRVTPSEHLNLVGLEHRLGQLRELQAQIMAAEEELEIDPFDRPAMAQAAEMVKTHIDHIQNDLLPAFSGSRIRGKCDTCKSKPARLWCATCKRNVCLGRACH